MSTTTGSGVWTTVCPLDAVDVEGGVAALVEGAAVAIFRTHDGNVYAISNYDPCCRASVLARGIVGTRGEIPVVASPMHKQAFDLRTGQCLDDAAVRVTTYDVRVVDQQVQVGRPREPVEGT
ncbi:nitrite reductase small subunit NirD [Nocardioides sp. SYSU D00038]|uniref:nitrite reductase small subunit NirD n=1 Tax=Nocardioides sp. SYSU D00038 TaxID=2812554 RepID=UPI0019674179|nr:nitrite reductase small subunit NirD [Nocardioides sp. SYSU D00038]